MAAVKQLLGVAEPPALQVNQAEPVQRLEMLRVAADDVAVDAGRFHKLTRLVET